MADMQERRERALWIGEHRAQGLRQLLMCRGFHAAGDEPSPNLRRARMIAYVLDHYPVEIGEDHLPVRTTSSWDATPPEEDLPVGRHTTRELTDPFSGRHTTRKLTDLLVGRYATRELTDPERQEMRRLWEPFRQWHACFPYGAGGVTGGHRAADYETLLRLGVEGILAGVEAHAARLDPADPEIAARTSFYEACRVSLGALLRFAERYREALARWASPLAAIFERVPRLPARTFHEALQSVWFVQFALGFDDNSCTGRPDQYLLPYYEADLAAGTLDRAGALHLIEELYLHSNEVYGDWPETLMVGGTDREGRPVRNDLTYLFIEAVERVGLVNPNVALCYREDTPDDLLRLCVQKIGMGLSHPAIYNDRVITEGLVLAGVAVEDARVYLNSTCVEITPVGCSNVQVSRPVLYPAKAMELLLNGGRQMVEDDRFLPREVGPETIAGWARPLAEGGMQVDLAALGAFEEFHTAYKDVFARLIGDCIEPALHEAEQMARAGASPLVSCFTRDCIARGKDAAQGGALYHYWGTMVPGFSTAVDSLLAIRQAVYREGMTTLAELAEALRRGFVGAEELRQYLLNRCPKYGNDAADADAIAVDLYDFINAELARYRTCLGGGFHIGLFCGWGGQPRGAHLNRGLVTAATPDGRRQAAPLSENIGPAPGAGRGGLLAVASSVTRMDHRRGIGGISLNCRLSRGLFTREDDREKVAAFLRGLMAKGAFEVQVNVVDTATLRDAQAHPERHRDLVVRVAGYSDYFHHLDPRLQEEIIARAEHADL